LGFSPSIALIQRNAIRLCSSNELWVLERESGDGELTEESTDEYCSALAWLGMQGVLAIGCLEKRDGVSVEVVDS